MPLHALLTELEGILIDTGRARREALTAALTATVGYAAVPDEATLARLAERQSFGDALRAACPTLDETDLELATLRAERAFDDALARVVVLVPGARDALADLATRLRVGVVTRLPRRVAERVLVAAELEPLIAPVIAAEDGGDAWTSAAYVRGVSRLARMQPTDGGGVVALVDSARAGDRARAAGLRVVVVGPERTSEVGAGARVASMAGVTYDALVQLLERSGVRPT